MKPSRDLRGLSAVPLSWLTPDLHHVAALEVVMKSGSWPSEPLATVRRVEPVGQTFK